MSKPDEWVPFKPDARSVLALDHDPLRALAQARIPAIIFRRAYDPDHCAGMIQRFIERGMMRDPNRPHCESEETFQFANKSKSRIDIGSSLVNRTRTVQMISDDKARNREDFLQHSAKTHELFSHLFEGFDHPVDTLYRAVSTLAPDKEVKVARDPDGRLYGPAIFRIHYTGAAYPPHINHAAIDDKLFEFSVSRFKHQFAGLICFQNSLAQGNTPHAVVYRCPWTPEVDSHLTDGTFHEFASANVFQTYQIEVEPGDFYLFNSCCVHEVAAVPGTQPRIVLATFIGYSEDDDEIFVWA